jgi:hypothetical protein
MLCRYSRMCYMLSIRDYFFSLMADWRVSIVISALALAVYANVCPSLEGHCRADRELCPNNVVCASNVCSLGRCSRDRAGAHCSTDQDCAGGFASDTYCVEGRCALIRSVNSKCESGQQCASGICNKETPHRCLGLPRGHECTRDIDCDFGLHCNNGGVCDVQVTLGGDCRHSADCAPLAETMVSCTAGKCAALDGTAAYVSRRICAYDGNCAADTEQCVCVYTHPEMSTMCASKNATTTMCATEWNALAACKFVHACAHWSNCYHSDECVYEHCADELIAAYTCSSKHMLVPPRCADYISSTLVPPPPPPSKSDTSDAHIRDGGLTRKGALETAETILSIGVFAVLALGSAFIIFAVFRMSRKAQAPPVSDYLQGTPQNSVHVPLSTDSHEQ